MSVFAAILLAAGQSRRMGGENKLALSFDGVALVRRSACTLLEAGVAELVVVTGYEAQRIESLLDGLPLRSVRNPRFAEGQMLSVHAGFAALGAECDAVMVALADQPLLTAADLRRLMGAFSHRKHGSILVPTWKGMRGNPVIVARAHLEEIRDGAADLGCRRLIERNPDKVAAFAMDNDHVVADVDTPDDYLRLRAGSERRAEAA